jgi:hypothetical protein
MSKKIIIAVVIILVVIIAVIAILFAQRNSPPGSSGSGGSTGTLPPPITVATSTPPTGNTITLGTSQGSVVVNNFYKTAAFITQDGQTVAIAQTSSYSIAYNVLYSSFVITVLAPPLEANREAAEAAFLSSLGISKQDACKLDIYEGVPASVSDQDSGRPYVLSFCPGSVGM